jgi:hypothetical protein
MQYFDLAVGIWLLFCVLSNVIVSNKSEDIKSIKHMLLAILYAILLLPIVFMSMMP